MNRPSSLFARLTEGELERLLEPERPKGVTDPRIILAERCPVCAHWMPAKSRERGQCGSCGAFFARAECAQ